MAPGPGRRLAALGVLYFVQGLPQGLQTGLLPLRLRGAGLPLTHLGLARGLLLPWLLKPLWAPAADRCRAPAAWLALSTGALALGSLACALLPPPAAGLPALAAPLLLLNLLAALQDAALDAAAARLLPPRQLGRAGALQVVAYKLGAAAAAAGGGLLAAPRRPGPAAAAAATLLAAAASSLAALYVWRAPELRLAPRHPPPASSLRPARLLRELLRAPGTATMAGFVLLYKLGEQGAGSVFPLFLLERGFTARQLGFWNGAVAAGFSVAGSLLGGELVAARRPPLSLLKTFLLLRFCSLSLQTLLVFAYRGGIFAYRAAAVLSDCAQHLFAGTVTTLTFSAMMQCTQGADASIQATHYSFLATLEVLGKLAFSTVAGGVVEQLGFPGGFCCFLALCLLALLYAAEAFPTGS
ncbi:major facilitator superfamily domain-containing protein 3 [Apteryx mantelli]|uniref:Major facilitator superfamily domain-containing protein 3 n=1 Tax=Apteryx mantelli TaxID=2696672 RepID=A0ABM4E6L2_9AVES